MSQGKLIGLPDKPWTVDGTYGGANGQHNKATLERNEENTDYPHVYDNAAYWTPDELTAQKKYRVDGVTRRERQHPKYWYCALVIAIVAICLAIAAGLAVAIYYTVADDGTDNSTKVVVVGESGQQQALSFQGDLKITDVQWLIVLKNKSSAEYKDLESDTKQQIDYSFKNSILKDIYNYTIINGFRQGSIVVDFTVVFKLVVEDTLEENKLLNTLIEEDIGKAFAEGLKALNNSAKENVTGLSLPRRLFQIDMGSIKFKVSNKSVPLTPRVPSPSSVSTSSHPTPEYVTSSENKISSSTTSATSSKFTTDMSLTSSTELSAGSNTEHASTSVSPSGTSSSDISTPGLFTHPITILSDTSSSIKSKISTIFQHTADSQMTTQPTTRVTSSENTVENILEISSTSSVGDGATMKISTISSVDDGATLEIGTTSSVGDGATLETGTTSSVGDGTILEIGTTSSVSNDAPLGIGTTSTVRENELESSTHSTSPPIIPIVSEFYGIDYFSVTTERSSSVSTTEQAYRTTPFPYQDINQLIKILFPCIGSINNFWSDQHDIKCGEFHKTLICVYQKFKASDAGMCTLKDIYQTVDIKRLLVRSLTKVYSRDCYNPDLKVPSLEMDSCDISKQLKPVVTIDCLVAVKFLNETTDNKCGVFQDIVSCANYFFKVSGFNCLVYDIALGVISILEDLDVDYDPLEDHECDTYVPTLITPYNTHNPCEDMNVLAYVTFYDCNHLYEEFSQSSGMDKCRSFYSLAHCSYATLNKLAIQVGQVCKLEEIVKVLTESKNEKTQHLLMFNKSLCQNVTTTQSPQGGSCGTFDMLKRVLLDDCLVAIHVLNNSGSIFSNCMVYQDIVSCADYFFALGNFQCSLSELTFGVDMLFPLLGVTYVPDAKCDKYETTIGKPLNTENPCLDINVMRYVTKYDCYHVYKEYTELDLKDKEKCRTFYSLAFCTNTILGNFAVKFQKVCQLDYTIDSMKKSSYFSFDTRNTYDMGHCENVKTTQAPQGGSCGTFDMLKRVLMDDCLVAIHVLNNSGSIFSDCMVYQDIVSCADYFFALGNFQCSLSELTFGVDMLFPLLGVTHVPDSKCDKYEPTIEKPLNTENPCLDINVMRYVTKYDCYHVYKEYTELDLKDKEKCRTFYSLAFCTNTILGNFAVKFQKVCQLDYTIDSMKKSSFFSFDTRNTYDMGHCENADSNGTSSKNHCNLEDYHPIIESDCKNAVFSISHADEKYFCSIYIESLTCIHYMAAHYSLPCAYNLTLVMKILDNYLYLEVNSALDFQVCKGPDNTVKLSVIAPFNYNSPCDDLNVKKYFMFFICKFNLMAYNNMNETEQCGYLELTGNCIMREINSTYPCPQAENIKKSINKMFSIILSFDVTARCPAKKLPTELPIGKCQLPHYTQIIENDCANSVFTMEKVGRDLFCKVYTESVTCIHFLAAHFLLPCAYDLQLVTSIFDKYITNNMNLTLNIQECKDSENNVTLSALEPFNYNKPCEDITILKYFMFFTCNYNTLDYHSKNATEQCGYIEEMSSCLVNKMMNSYKCEQVGLINSLNKMFAVVFRFNISKRCPVELITTTQQPCGPASYKRIIEKNCSAAATAFKTTSADDKCSVYIDTVACIYFVSSHDLFPCADHLEYLADQLDSYLKDTKDSFNPITCRNENGTIELPEVLPFNYTQPCRDLNLIKYFGKYHCNATEDYELLNMEKCRYFHDIKTCLLHVVPENIHCKKDDVILSINDLAAAFNMSECTYENKCMCENRGICIERVEGYVCICAAGYTGFYCQTDIDECASHHCQNGATCIDGINTYTCKCAKGYTGDWCQKAERDTVPLSFQCAHDISKILRYQCIRSISFIDTVSGDHKCRMYNDTIACVHYIGVRNNLTCVDNYSSIAEEVDWYLQAMDQLGDYNRTTCRFSDDETTIHPLASFNYENPCKDSFMLLYFAKYMCNRRIDEIFQMTSLKEKCLAVSKEMQMINCVPAGVSNGFGCSFEEANSTMWQVLWPNLQMLLNICEGGDSITELDKRNVCSKQPYTNIMRSYCYDSIPVFLNVTPENKCSVYEDTITCVYFTASHKLLPCSSNIQFIVTVFDEFLNSTKRDEDFDSDTCKNSENEIKLTRTKPFNFTHPCGDLNIIQYYVMYGCKFVNVKLQNMTTGDRCRYINKTSECAASIMWSSFKCPYEVTKNTISRALLTDLNYRIACDNSEGNDPNNQDNSKDCNQPDVKFIDVITTNCFASLTRFLVVPKEYKCRVFMDIALCVQFVAPKSCSWNLEFILDSTHELINRHTNGSFNYSQCVGEDGLMKVTPQNYTKPCRDLFLLKYFLYYDCYYKSPHFEQQSLQQQCRFIQSSGQCLVSTYYEIFRCPQEDVIKTLNEFVAFFASQTGTRCSDVIPGNYSNLCRLRLLENQKLYQLSEQCSAHLGAFMYKVEIVDKTELCKSFQRSVQCLKTQLTELSCDPNVVDHYAEMRMNWTLRDWKYSYNTLNPTECQGFLNKNENLPPLCKDTKSIMILTTGYCNSWKWFLGMMENVTENTTTDVWNHCKSHKLLQTCSTELLANLEPVGCSQPDVVQAFLTERNWTTTVSSYFDPVPCYGANSSQDEDAVQEQSGSSDDDFVNECEDFSAYGQYAKSCKHKDLSSMTEESAEEKCKYIKNVINCTWISLRESNISCSKLQVEDAFRTITTNIESSLTKFSLATCLDSGPLEEICSDVTRYIQYSRKCILRITNTDLSTYKAICGFVSEVVNCIESSMKNRGFSCSSSVIRKTLSPPATFKRYHPKAGLTFCFDYHPVAMNEAVPIFTHNSELQNTEVPRLLMEYSPLECNSVRRITHLKSIS